MKVAQTVLDVENFLQGHLRPWRSEDYAQRVLLFQGGFLRLQGQH